jgi:hypothetical protein
MPSKLCTRRAVRGNIEWSQIPRGAEVALCGHMFVVRMPRSAIKKVAFWGGQDARKAQDSLEAWAKRGRR